jgi:HSP20 family molecular chaperone IbpA
MMEIESGPFVRILKFPRDIDTEKVTARQENGLLWITLPIVT